MQRSRYSGIRPERILKSAVQPLRAVQGRTRYPRPTKIAATEDGGGQVRAAETAVGGAAVQDFGPRQHGAFKVCSFQVQPPQLGIAQPRTPETGAAQRQPWPGGATDNGPAIQVGPFQPEARERDGGIAALY